MKNVSLILCAALMLASTPAKAVIVARFTGFHEQVTTVTGSLAWKCQYDYFGQKFYRLFKQSCPSTIEVE